MFAMENKVADSLGKFSEQLKAVRHELVGHLQVSAHLFPVLSPKKQVMVNGNSGLQVAILNAMDSSSTLDSLHSLLLPKVLHKMLFAGMQFMSDLPHLKVVEVTVKCCCLFIPNDSQRLSELHCTHLPLHNG